MHDRARGKFHRQEIVLKNGWKRRKIRRNRIGKETELGKRMLKWGEKRGGISDLK